MYNSIIKMFIALMLVGYGMTVSYPACAHGIIINHLRVFITRARPSWKSRTQFRAIVVMLYEV